MRRWFYFLLLVLLIGLLGAGAVFAQGGGSFSLPWFTFDGGGGTSSGGSFDLSGTVGQADVGSMAGGDFVLAGGFWPGIGGANPAPAHAVYLPIAVKNP